MSYLRVSFTSWSVYVKSIILHVGSLAKKANNWSIPVASLKFPPITSISHSSARTKDWDDVLTTHSDETFARTWTMQNKKLGKHTFGFSDSAKGKGKERAPILGSAKVGFRFRVVSNLLIVVHSQSVLPRAETLV